MNRLTRPLLKAATVGALLVGALISNQRLAGTSPIAWIDTFNDEQEVQQCLVGNSCTLTGVGTSVPGQVHGVAWLELRALLAWLGVGLDGAHLVMQFLNALAVVLVFHLATQLGGRLAGAAAVWILLFGIDALSVRLTALYNSSPLLFLGAVFVLACTAVVERPGVVSVALAALVGAVMANVHLACVMTGLSVVWVALLAPRRRFLLAAFGAALFAVATVIVAPPSWLYNLTSLLAHREASGGATGVMPLQGGDLLRWALFAVAAWVASLVSRAPAWVEYRRRSQGAFAVIVPFLAAYIVGARFGLNANAKYLAHLKAACAIAAALPVALVAGTLLRRSVPRRLVLSVEQILPFVVALVIAVPTPLSVTADDERTPTIGDLVAVAHVLHDEHGWDVSRMIEHLKTPYGLPVLMGLQQLSAAGNGPSPVVADVGTSVLLMMLEADELPHPLPSSWTVVRRSTRAATVLVFMQSRIDWSKFEVCTPPADGLEQHCEESGWRFDEAAAIFNVQNMPPAGLRSRGTLKLRLPLRPAAPGFTEEIFMPRMRDVCGGHIATVSDGTFRVDADRRRATLSAAKFGQASPSTIELEWNIGSPECDEWAYDGLPPCIIAGDAATVQLLEAILRKREG
jgi:hypothetical protein